MDKRTISLLAFLFVVLCIVSAPYSVNAVEPPKECDDGAEECDDSDDDDDPSPTWQ